MISSCIKNKDILYTNYARTAIYLSLLACEVKNKQVLLPAFTCNTTLPSAIIQAGAIFLVSNNMSIYWHGASINNPSSGSTNLLHWEAIKIFKSAGLKFFDLGGLSLNTSDEKAQSISRFKIRFGGEVKCFTVE